MLASNTNDANTLQTNGSTRTTILVVDDDTTARLTIAAMISNEDEYRVVLDSGAAQARERLPSIEPDAPAVSKSAA